MPLLSCHAASLPRRSVLLGAAALAGGLALPARSQEVGRIYVGFAAGGVTDLAARMLAPALSEELGQTFIVENRPGASSALAIKAVEGSAPSSNTFVLYPTLALLGFLLNGQQPALDRITPVSLLYEQFAVLAINPQVPGLENVRTLQDLLQVAKAKAGALTYTSSGVGSTGHLAMEWVCSLAGVKMQHVPYKGGAPAVTDVLGGHVGTIFADSTIIAPHVKSGKVRALAVNYPVRVPGFADVPTVAEQGFKEVSAVPWVVLAGPPGMPDAAASRMAAAVRRVVARPGIVQSMQEQNMVPRHSTPQETRQLMQRDMLAWRKIIEDNGIKL